MAPKISGYFSARFFFLWSAMKNLLYLNSPHTIDDLKLVVVGPAGRPDHDQQHCYHHAPTVNQRLLLQLLWLLMMGVRMPETC
jgi:hypothetical protein